MKNNECYLPNGDMKNWEESTMENLISAEHEICFDFCAEVGQMFDNIKHMRWFRENLLDYVKENNPDLLKAHPDDLQYGDEESYKRNQ